MRHYTWEGKAYPSVTSLRRIVGMPFTLHNWVLNQHIQGAVDLIHDPRVSSMADLEITKAIRKLGDAKRDRAADLGIRVHASTAAGIVPDHAPPDEAPLLRQYQHWLASERADVLYSERQVFSIRMGYGGSFDLLIRDRFGRIVLIDIKTGEAYLDHVLQLLGYTLADFIGEDDVIDPTATDLLMQVEAIALLKLTPTDWQYIEVEADEQSQRAFRSMCHLAHWLDDHTVADYTTRTETGGIS